MSERIERLGRYELIAPRPGQENTYLARRRGAGAFERYVVVRVVDLSSESAGMLRLHIDEELWPLGHLHHQHLRNVVDVEEHADRLLVVTEYVHGCTVREVIECGAQLPYDFGLTVCAHAASALHHMHTRTTRTGAPFGMIHRGVSPSTLWVGYEGAVKLGLALRLGDAATPRFDYLSPEQVTGKPIGVLSDVFSLGSVMYELTTGASPFRDATEMLTAARIRDGAYALPSQVIANYPPELEAIIARALQVEPGARYESAEAMRQAIAALGHHYELVLGDAAIVEVMSQLFETPREPWLQDAPAPEPTSTGALAYDFDLPSVRPQRNPMRSATELVEELSSILEPPTGRPRTPLPEEPEAHAEFEEGVPTRLAPTPAELLAQTAPSEQERVQSIQRLFTESAFDPRETPASPISSIEDATTRHVTNEGIVDLGATTGGVPVLPASVPLPAAPATAPPRSRRILWIALVAIALGGLGIGGYWLATREPAASPPSAPVRPVQIVADSAPVEPVPPDTAPDAAIGNATPDAAPDAAPDAIGQGAPDAGGPAVALKLTSAPSGATVLLDGKRLGKTPFDATAPLIGKGPHAVKVRLTGYNTVKLDVTGDLLEKEVVLVKAKPKPEEPKPDE